MHLYHSGVGHDDNPPGRGSGRYAYGSGKRPFQSYKSNERRAIIKLIGITNQLKNNTGVAKKVVKTSDTASFGTYYDNVAGSAWMGLQLLKGKSGEDLYFPPAKVLKDFIEIGQNPYPQVRLEDRSLKDVNPGFGERGTTQNCTKCGAAVELRERGYAVTAGKANGGDCQSFLDWFNDCKEVRTNTFDELKESLLSESTNGEVVRGVINGRWSDDMPGHTINYEAQRYSDGSRSVINIKDGQSGEKFYSLEDAFNHYGFSKDIMMQHYRLDNCDINFDNMANDSTIGAPIGETMKYINKLDGRMADRW